MRNHEANSLTTSAVRGVRRFHDAISGCRFDSLFGSMSDRHPVDPDIQHRASLAESGEQHVDMPPAVQGDANGRIGDPPGVVVRPLDVHDERTPVLRRGPSPWPARTRRP